ncbi:hypothetical protein ACIBKX_33205 [Streptomyces sp. NPDC050658]|uniref:hypothetical protein n=1 Tax=unclassified Streptomyces TaxID=2593676 RepID=UPI003438CC90
MYSYLVVLAIGAAAAVVAATAPASRAKRAVGRRAAHMSLRSSIDAEAFVELARSARARAERVSVDHESERMASAVEQACNSECAAAELVDPHGAAEAYSDAALAAYIASALAYNDAPLGRWAIGASHRAYVAAVHADQCLSERHFWKASRAEEAAVDWIERIRPFAHPELERAEEYPMLTATAGLAPAEALDHPDVLELERTQVERRAED